MLGAGRQGQALVRFMAEHGASVTLSDAKPLDQLSDAVKNLSDLPVVWAAGGHPLSLLEGKDCVFVTGGANLQIPILQEATRRNIPIKNDTAVFLDRVSAPVIGITGSSGKTTTTTLVGRIAEAAAKPEQKVWIGGNIGLPLLTFADKIKPEDIVILELSSFQLELQTRSPHISAILNITPNHLDRHGTMENYISAKKRIYSFQNENDFVILSRDNDVTSGMINEIKDHLFTFGFDRPASLKEDTAVFLEGDQIKCLSHSGKDISEEVLLPVSLIELRGRHNISNVMAACAISKAAGFTAASITAGITGFKGVEHRLQFIRRYHGAAWYNDSIATAPERTLAAVHSFTEPLIMLLGGRDKKLPWDELAHALQGRARWIFLFGEAEPMIETVLKKADPKGEGPKIVCCEDLENAVKKAAEVCADGDVVLLSPGGTSYDAFKDFEERGRKYTEWVNQLS